MAPLMFTFNRATQTPEQHSQSVKSIEEIKNRQTCSQKYSFYAQTRKISNCTKVQNVYLKGKLIGHKYCIPF
jgi:hypothetical protein|tara:strand:- start:411 stop:626 length:216 start_codon:yes stop_codon:yes gene_type:complete